MPQSSSAHDIWKPEVLLGVRDAYTWKRPDYFAQSLFPDRPVQAKEIDIDIRRPRNYGLMQASGPLDKGNTVPLHGMKKRTYKLGYFKERVILDEEDLLMKRRPGTVSEILTVNEQVEDALELLMLRQDQLMEHLDWEVLQNFGFTINENGINYTVSYPQPSNLAIAASAPWDDYLNADPLLDIGTAVGRITGSGFRWATMHLPYSLLFHLGQTDQFVTLINAVMHNWSVGQLPAGKDGGQLSLFNNLLRYRVTVQGGPPPQFVENNDKYWLETATNADIAATGTSVQVDDIRGFAVGDEVTIEAYDTEANETKTLTGVTPATKTLTWAAPGTTNAYAKGATVRTPKGHLRKDRVTLLPDPIEGANMSVLPLGSNLVGPIVYAPAGDIDAPGAGRGLEVFIHRMDNPKFVEIVSALRFLPALQQYGAHGYIQAL